MPAPEDLPTDPDALLTYRQAARLLNSSERTVWALVREHGLPAVRMGASVRIRRRTLLDWIEAREREASGT